MDASGGLFWGLLGPRLGLLGASWGPLGPSWGLLGASWGGRAKGSIDRYIVLQVMAGHQSFQHELKRHTPYRPGQSNKDSPGFGYLVQAGPSMAASLIAASSHSSTGRVASDSPLDAAQQRPLDSTLSDFEPGSKASISSVRCGRLGPSGMLH